MNETRIQLWGAITPVDPASTWIPLLFIFTVSGAKEALDDWRRHKTDQEANNRPCKRIRTSDLGASNTRERSWATLRSSLDTDDDTGGRTPPEEESSAFLDNVRARDLALGDLVVIHQDEEIPCDLVMLSSSNADASCFIETANIDGETDYKLRVAANATRGQSQGSLSRTRLLVECSLPNARVYEFDARMMLMTSEDRRVLREAGPRAVAIGCDQARWQALSSDNLLLQGTMLRSTTWVVGCAVYTGNETKLGCSKEKAPSKFTRADKLIDRVAIGIFCFQLVLVLIFGIIGNWWQNTFAGGMWYVDYQHGAPILSGLPLRGLAVLVIPLRFLLLNSMMIPISLKVTLDVAKLCYAKFIDWDDEMKFDDGVKVHEARAISTAISEDLGQIQYVFTDKTGTLTENIMEFVACSIAGSVYATPKSGGQEQSTDEIMNLIDVGDEAAEKFVQILGICHTVMASGPSTRPEYRAASPDELALVHAARDNFGLTFINQDQEAIVAEWDERIGQKLRYRPLATLEFSSNRKRMSVVLKDEITDRLWLFTKGADEAILPLLSSTSRGSNSFRRAQEHMEAFGVRGLRTLVLAYKQLSADKVLTWLDDYSTARAQMDGREAAVTAAFQLLETDMTFAGATAIEDKLQQGVPEAIRDLRAAGMRVWMLTGDKLATAVQIGKSCNLISERKAGHDGGEDLVFVQGDDSPSIYGSLRCGDGPFSLIVEGTVLGHILHSSELSDAFAELAMRARTVICCRVTPQQKADVVALVTSRGFNSLAIGDGGNDVAMIQTAAVGVGISGREGLQAARAADYAIGQFRFLVRLCLVHGRYSVHRTGFIAQYCFYKSMLICFVQILYQFFTGFSGTTFFNTFSLTTYNILFTSLPVFAFILDRDLPIDVCVQFPELYESSQSGRWMNKWTFFGWFMRAIGQATLVFFCVIGAYASSSIDDDGIPMDYAALPIVAYSALLLVNAGTQLQASNSLTWVNHVIIWGTPVVYLVSHFVTSEIPSTQQFGTADRLLGDPRFWFSVLVASAVALIPVFAFHRIRREEFRLKIAAALDAPPVRKSSDAESAIDTRTITPAPPPINNDRSPLLRLRSNAQ